MKLKKLLFILALAGITALSLMGFTACKKDKTSDASDGPSEITVWNFDTVYAHAAELGYEGTFEEFLATVQGKDGVGITAITLNSQNELIILFASLMGGGVNEPEY